MAALATVADYIARARVLLLDEVVEYRYKTSDLVGYLNEGIMEARRVRPDLFLGRFRTGLPSYSEASPTDAVTIDEQYRMAFVYYMAGQAQLADQEETEDQRALAFIGKFTTTLVGNTVGG